MEFNWWKKSFSFSVRYQVARHCAFKPACLPVCCLACVYTGPPNVAGYWHDLRTNFEFLLHKSIQMTLSWFWKVEYQEIMTRETKSVILWQTMCSGLFNDFPQHNNVLMHCYNEVHWVLFIVFTRTLSTCIFRRALSSIPFTGFCCEKRYVFLKTFLIIVYRVLKINSTQKKNLTGF